MTEFTVAVRFVHLTASILVLGVFSFVCLVARPAADRAGARAPFEHWQRRLWRIVAAALVAIVISGIAALVLQAAAMSGRTIADVFVSDALGAAFSTQYGRVWLVRQALLLALAGVCIPLLQSRQPPRAIVYLGFALAALALGAMAFAGHAAANEGATLVLQVGADVLHLLAAGVWLGALLPLALLLAWVRRSDTAWAGAVAQAATRRFSWLGIACVATLIVAGLTNAWNLVGSIAPLVGTAYGRLLLLKVALLLPLLLFAAMNLLYLRPQLLRSPPRMQSFVFGGLLTALQRNTVVEVIFGVAILSIVALLGVTPPALHVPPEWPFPFRFSLQVSKSIHAQWTRVIAGAAVVALALVPLLYALLFRRGRRAAAVAGVALIIGGALAALPALSLDAYPTTYRRPAIAYQAISVASGSQLYQQHCVGCHGIAGFGDGPAATTLTPKPADLTAKHTGDHTAGDLFWWLTHGKDKTAMPGFESSVSEEGRWDLINFLRALSAAEQARAMAPLLEPPWLVAPDFLYQTLRGENRTLKEHRARNVVLLVLFTLPSSQLRLEQLAQLHAQLAANGVEILAVPSDVRAARERLRAPPYAVVSDGAEEAFVTYGLFRRSLSEEGMQPDAPAPAHMEFLIDRQGYVRARWIPMENRAWANAEILLGEIDQLNREKPSAPAPEDHVH